MAGPAVTGFRKYGVPPGGPFDRESWAWSVALSGTGILPVIRELSALELGPFGGLFRAEADLTLAVVGAERAMRLNGAACSQGRLLLHAGDHLEVGAVIRGARSYVALSGHLPSNLGLEQRRVVRDDLIPASVGAPPKRIGALPSSLSASAIRCVDGPQAKLFDLEELYGRQWKVTSAADRMGVRLGGPELMPTEPWGERPSEPQTPGCIQVTVGGSPIILGPDGPTIGGYPKIAVVIDADMDKVGQLMAGSSVTFDQIGLDEARALRQDYRKRLSAALFSQ